MTDVFDISSWVADEVDKIIGMNEGLADYKGIDTLVLSGGSLKGMAQLGALHKMDEMGILDNITTFAGSSIGSVVATMTAIGFKPNDMFTFFTKVDIRKTLKADYKNLINNLGLDDGKRFVLVIRKFFKAANMDPDITFSEMYKITRKHVIITGVCVDEKKVYYFDHLTEPNMKVINALRISISIPIIFTPRKHKSKVFIDGGFIDNYPIHMFRHKLNKVIGVYVSDKKRIEKIDSAEKYLVGILDCLKEGMTFNANRGYDVRTIFVVCQMGDTKEYLSEMFDSGYRMCEKFFKTRSK